MDGVEPMLSMFFLLSDYETRLKMSDLYMLLVILKLVVCSVL